MSAPSCMACWVGGVLLGALLIPAQAADAPVQTSAPVAAQAPAPSAAQNATQAATQSAAPAGEGTTIVGESEAAVGLFLLPWQEEDANTLDHPPGLYDVSLDPLDVAGYQRWVDYEQARAQYRRERLHRTH